MSQDRVCEVCSRKGGGDPERGLDNVVIWHGHQLCGYCCIEADWWLWSKTEAALTKWVESKKASAA
jgi:hypothetical protein